MYSTGGPVMKARWDLTQMMMMMMMMMVVVVVVVMVMMTVTTTTMRIMTMWMRHVQQLVTQRLAGHHDIQIRPGVLF